MDLDAKNLAIDKPTTRISNFMRKHYQLSKLVNQDNNIGIYEEFFREKCENFIYFIHIFCM